MQNVLTWMIFAPVAGAAVVLLLPRGRDELVRWISLLATAVPLALAFWVYANFDRTSPGLQFVEHYAWIPAFNIEYFLGLDGVSAPMFLLTTLIAFLALVASWGIKEGVKGYFCLYLLLEAGMLGVFAALDFFLFFIFWEVSLLPMYFLIGIWGGPEREYAAIKFFLYTLFGSVLILLAMLALYFANEPHTFDMTKLIAANKQYGIAFQLLVFIALYIGFAIKVPVFPFHTWLPDAHVEAPTPISVILAGILLKMGTYGMLRVSWPMLPEALKVYAYPLAIFALINIVYGALVAMAQRDFKKLVAYSSISHMGFVLLGMCAIGPQGLSQAGVNGAILQMFNHGTVTAMLFLLVGVLYDRAHHRVIEDFGGLGVQMPVYAGVATVAFFAALGLPGLSSFISEALVLIGAFPAYRTLTIIAAVGIIITAGYWLWTLQRVFLGPLNPKYATLPEINGRELVTLVPLGALVLFLGVYPMPVLDLIRASADQLIALVGPLP
ncbi:MAG: NADH-quinone oxidoreductase subunit M [Deltaproteobacteria bacterium]|nr:NADH-quinone oxidoreductase subunit M [Deltaproteobacteria bacterium]